MGEAFATEDQTNETTARLDHIVCHHGVPVELLSDRRPNLLSNLIQDVCSLLGMRKINMTAYHPQYRLVENFDQTLRSMLAKHAKEFGPACNRNLHHQARPHSSSVNHPSILFMVGILTFQLNQPSQCPLHRTKLTSVQSSQKG